jgi:hypothetical protein
MRKPLPSVATRSPAPNRVPPAGLSSSIPCSTQALIPTRGRKRWRCFGIAPREADLKVRLYVQPSTRFSVFQGFHQDSFSLVPLRYPQED